MSKSRQQSESLFKCYVCVVTQTLIQLPIQTYTHTQKHKLPDTRCDAPFHFVIFLLSVFKYRLNH